VLYVDTGLDKYGGLLMMKEAAAVLRSHPQTVFRLLADRELQSEIDPITLRGAVTKSSLIAFIQRASFVAPGRRRSRAPVPPRTVIDTSAAPVAKAS
jgi:hypothetical protein